MLFDRRKPTMSDTYTEATRTDWSTRIAASIKGIGAGVILAGLAGYGLFWNEGSAVQTAKSLTEGAGLVVNIDAARVDPAHESKLVHVTGEIKAGVKPNDAEFGVAIDSLRLVRTAEMFQWREDRKIETNKNVGGSEDAVTTYSYKKVWSSSPINSQEFKVRDGHANPAMRYSGATFDGGDVTLGAFRPGEQVIRMLPDNQNMLVDAAMAEALGARVHGPVQAIDGRFYLGDDPSQPRIGEMRISYHFAPAGPVSIIAQQSGSDFTPYQTKAGNRILMVTPGMSSAVDMFSDAQRENVIWTWILRFICAFIIFIGFKLILDPIVVIADVVPFIGNLMGAGAALVAFIVTAIVAPVVIAVAWLWYRPMVSLIMIAAGAGLALGLRVLAGRRTPTQQAAPVTA
jgi:transmembrane protein TMEM43